MKYIQKPNLINQVIINTLFINIRLNKNHRID